MQKKLAIFLSLIVLIILPELAFGGNMQQWTPLNGVSLFSEAQTQWDQQEISDGSGGAIITWSDQRNGSDIYVQRINSSGTPQWTTGGVKLSSGFSKLPQLVSDGSGGAIVTWLSDYNSISAQRVSRSGAVQWGTGTVVCTTAQFNAGYPMLSADNAGGAVISWYDTRGAGPSVYAQKVNSSGVVQWANSTQIVVLPAWGTDQFQGPIWMASDGSGGAFIAFNTFHYIPYVDTMPVCGVDIQRINSSGICVWNGGVPVNVASDNVETLVGVVPDGNNGAVLGWIGLQPATTTNQQNLYAQRFDPSGNQLWASGGGIVNNSNDIIQFARLVNDGGNNSIFAWVAWSNNYLYTQKISLSGTRLWSNDACCSNDGHANYTQPLCADGSGGAIVSWMGLGGITANRVDTNGSVLWGSNGTLVSSSSVNGGNNNLQDYCNVVTDGGKGGIFTWSNTNIMMQRLCDTAPVVVSSFAAPDHFKITFDQDVNLSDVANPSNYILQSPVGTNINLSVWPSYDSATFTATFSSLSLQAGNSYKITAVNIKNQSGTAIVNNGTTNVSSGTVIGGFDHFVLSAIGASQQAGNSFSFTVLAKDSVNGTITSFNSPVNVSDLSGNIRPKTIILANGAWSGTMMVTSPYANDTVTTSCSGISATTNTFNVSGQPVTNMTDEWTMALHDSRHTGTTSEIISPVLTKNWTWVNPNVFDNTMRNTLYSGYIPGCYYWFPVFHSGNIYLQGGGNCDRLHCLNTSGQEVWTFNAFHSEGAWGAMCNGSTNPAVVNNRIVINTTDEINSVDPANGSTLSFYGPNMGGSAVGGMAVWNNLLYHQGIEQDNGTEEVLIFDGINYYTPLWGNLMVDQYIYSPGMWSTIPHAYDASFKLPAVDDYIFYENSYGILTARSALTDQPIWAFGGGNFQSTSPAVENGVVYFYSSNSGQLCAINSKASYFDSNTSTSSISFKWKKTMGRTWCPIVSDGVIYTGDNDMNFYAIDCATGNTKWTLALTTSFDPFQQPAISGNNIFIPGPDGNLYILNKNTGTGVNTIAVNPGVRLGPVMIAGGNLYVSDYKSNFFCYMPSSIAKAPEVTTISPVSVVSGSPNTISIIGNGYFGGGTSTAVTGVSIVQVGGGSTALSGYTVVNDTLITGAVIPGAVSAGSYKVIVADAAGNSTNSPLINIIAPGVIPVSILGYVPNAGFSPSFGTADNCFRHVVKASDGTLIAIYPGDNQGGSTGYVVYNMSFDGGKTWTCQARILYENSANVFLTTGLYADELQVIIDKNDYIFISSFLWGQGQQVSKLVYNGSTSIQVSSGYPVVAATVSGDNVSFSYTCSLLKEPSGKLWMAYQVLSGGYFLCAKSSNDDGKTWSSAVQLSSAGTNNISAKPYLVEFNGKPYCILSQDGASGYMSYMSFNGTSWSAPAVIPGNISNVAFNFSATTTWNGKLHLVYESNGVGYTNFNGSSWSTPVVMDASGAGPSISTDGINLWCFYITGNNLVYKTSTIGSFAGTESVTAITSDGNINQYSSASEVTSQVIPVFWTSGLSSSTVGTATVKAAVLSANNSILAPAVTSIFPFSGATTRAATINIAGSGFFAGLGSNAVTKIRLDDASRTVLSGYSVNSDNSITGAIVPSGMLPGTYNIMVTTPGGVNTLSAQKFAVTCVSYPVTGVANVTNDYVNTANINQQHVVIMSDGSYVAVYYDNGNIVASISRDNGATWSGKTNVGSIGFLGGAETVAESSIFKDSSNNLYIGYLNASGYWNNTGYVNKFSYSNGTLTQVSGFPKAVGSALNAAAPAIVKEPVSGNLWFTYRMGWHCYTVSSANDGGNWSTPTDFGVTYSGDMLLKNDGYPGILLTGNDSDPWWKEWNGSSWSTGTDLASIIATGPMDCSVAITSNNYIHVVFAANGSGLLSTYFDGTIWHAKVPVDNTYSGTMPALTTDGTNLYCVYVNSNNNGVSYKVMNATGGDNWVACAPIIISNGTNNAYPGVPSSISPTSQVPVIWTNKGPINNIVQFTGIEGKGNVTPPVISAPTVAAGTTTATITWNTNLFSDSQVLYGTSSAYNQGSPVNTTLVTAHSLTLAGLTSGTAYHYQIELPDMLGNLATTADAVFNTLAAGPVPIVTNLSPSTAVNTSSVTLSLSGTNFTGATAVKISSTTSTDTYSASSFSVMSASAIYPAVFASGSKAGPYNVFVTNASGTNSSSSTLTITTTAPSISAVTPNTWAAGTAATVSITGTRFFGGTLVSDIRGVKISGTITTNISGYTVSSDSSVSNIMIPATFAAGTYNIAVTTGGGDSNLLPFTINGGSSLPVVSSISPNNGYRHIAVTLNITGSGFCGGGSNSIVSLVQMTGSSTVTLSGYTVTNDTLISNAVLPAWGYAGGIQDVRVVTTAGTSVTNAGDQYTVTSLPVPTVVSSSATVNVVSVTFNTDVTGATNKANYSLVVGGNSVSLASAAITYNNPTATISGLTLASGNTYTVTVTNVCNGEGDNIGSTNSGSGTVSGSDSTPPSNCSIAVNGGSPYTNSTSVSLALSATDNSGTVSQMAFSNNGTTWVTSSYSTSAAWSLSAGDGSKTVQAKFADPTGNWSTAVTSNSILLDATAPAGSIVINSGNAYTNSTTVTLTLSSTDTGSGLSQMEFSNDNSIWSTAEAYGTSKVWTLAANDGAKTVYVKYKDNAGNWSSVTISDSITLDTVAPAGTVLINNNAVYTRTSTVTLNLNATDAGSGVYQMQVDPTGTGSGYGSWVSYSTSTVITLPSGDGNKTVLVKYKDNAGNQSTSVNDTIKYTTTDHLKVQLTGLDPSEANAGDVLTLQISARKADDSVNPGFVDTVHTVYSDATVTPVADYLFLSGDNSTTLITITPNLIGKQTITVTDKDVPEVKAGSLTIDVYAIKSIGANGGRVENVDGSSVDIPAGLLSGSCEIVIKVPDLLPGAAKSFKYRATTNPIGRDFGVIDRSSVPWKISSFSFNGEVALTIPYTKADVGELDEQALRIFYYNPNSVRYDMLAGTQSIAGGKVTAKTTHFSTYRLLATYTATDLSNVWAYPNPFKASSAYDNAFKIVNIPKDAQADVYTIAGVKARTLKEADMSNAGWIEWDGKNDAGEYVTCGVYAIVIKCASGNKVIKVGVIK